MPVDGLAPLPSRSPRALAPGDVVAGRYRVVKPLGRGSFGHTYLAVDTAAGGREVALKQLRAEGEGGWKALELFEREAAALRSLRHHGIPEIFDHLQETADGVAIAYLVMEYVAGPTLELRIEEHAGLDPAALLRLALGLLDILEYLHARVPPVLHRDIKPANVILRPDGAPALVDFGAVRTVFRTAGEGGSTVVGTFGYMPFEQYMGQASPASDLYALGATLLHVITGRGPAEFATGDGVVEVPPDLPGGPVLRAVLARLLAPTASARYQSARAVREALLAPAIGPQEAPRSAALVRVPSVALAPGPRTIEGELRTRFDRVVIGPVNLLYSSHRPSQPLSGQQRMLALLFGLLSLGIVPLVYLLWYASRRARVRRFFEHGVPASGRILQVQNTSYEWIEVTHEFTLAGVTHRGADTMFPAVARLWQAGDEVELLVLPDQGFDSIIISSA
ncbi:MAG: serine/threonine protein kinase [Myxococcales bacterium]|nr:serine/threonine protein kinase [Myxococcales bacterium]